MKIFRFPGKDYFVHISGRFLFVTGRNSAKYIDKAWSAEKAADVTTVRFTCVSFGSLVSVFHRIKFRFPNVEHLVFNECEFNYIGQLNALAAVQGFKTLEILPEQNAILKKNWRSYAIFRLRHWGLQKINNVSVSRKIRSPVPTTTSASLLHSYKSAISKHTPPKADSRSCTQIGWVRRNLSVP